MLLLRSGRDAWSRMNSFIQISAQKLQTYLAFLTLADWYCLFTLNDSTHSNIPNIGYNPHNRKRLNLCQHFHLLCPKSLSFFIVLISFICQSSSKFFQDLFNKDVIFWPQAGLMYLQKHCVIELVSHLSLSGEEHHHLVKQKHSWKGEFHSY